MYLHMRLCKFFLVDTQGTVLNPNGMRLSDSINANCTSDDHEKASQVVVLLFRLLCYASRKKGKIVLVFENICE